MEIWLTQSCSHSFFSFFFLYYVYIIHMTLRAHCCLPACLHSGRARGKERLEIRRKKRYNCQLGHVGLKGISLENFVFNSDFELDPETFQWNTLIKTSPNFCKSIWWDYIVLYIICCQAFSSKRKEPSGPRKVLNQAMPSQMIEPEYTMTKP